MRIAMISPYPAPEHAPRGGVEVSVVRLVEGLAARGVDVEVISTGGCPLETRNRIAIHRARSRRLTTARFLRPWRADVRRILDTLDVDIVHGQGLMPPGVAATDVPSMRCPRVVTAHGNRREDAYNEYRGPSAIARGALVERLSALAARRADLVIGVHPDWQVNVPVQPRRYAYVPNIVDDRFFEAERHPQRGHVLFCGGSTAIKGWDLLADAWPKVLEHIGHATLEATGFDDHAPAALSRRIPGAEIRGWLTGAELRTSMERADVLVVPSQFEVAPVIVAEAWAAGVPVVAAGVGGIPGMTTGAAVIAEREPKSFARAIADVLLGRVDVDALVREGRIRAEACRRQNVIDAHLRIYRDLLG